MPFDSNGVFTRVMNWTSDQQNGIAIECGRHDQEDDNFAAGFNDTFCRDGRAAATGDFNLDSHKIKNLADGTISTDAVNKGQMDTGLATKANDNAVVHLAGTETITGAKTFSSAVTLANNAWNTIGDDVQIGDMNNAGKLCIRGINGYTGIYFYPENGNNSANGIYLQPENYNGLLLTDTSSSRAWGSILCTDSYIQNNSEGNGYYKLGNGLIIQWGTIALNGQNWVIVRLPIAFTSTNYQVALSAAEVGWQSGVMLQTRSKTTTTFETLGQGSPLSWIAIGY